MLKYLIAVILFGPLLILSTPLLLVMYFKPNWFSLKFRYGFIHFLLKWLAITLRVDYHIDGLENIPSEGPVLITPNHQSFFDSLSMIIIFKTPVTFVAKKETKKMPYIGLICSIIDGFFIDREDIRQSLKLMKNVEEYMINNENRKVVIFPEGTRTRNPDLSLGEFKAGTFKVAYKSKATIIPTSMTGTPRILHMKWYWKHRVDIRFGKPLLYEDYKDMNTIELANYCENFAKENLKELHKINDCRKKVDEK